MKVGGLGWRADVDALLVTPAQPFAVGGGDWVIDGGHAFSGSVQRRQHRHRSGTAAADRQHFGDAPSRGPCPVWSHAQRILSRRAKEPLPPPMPSTSSSSSSTPYSSSSHSSSSETFSSETNANPTLHPPRLLARAASGIEIYQIDGMLTDAECDELAALQRSREADAREAAGGGGGGASRAGSGSSRGRGGGGGGGVGAGIGRGIHSLSSELNLSTSLSLEHNLSTFGTHPWMNISYMGNEVSLS